MSHDPLCPEPDYPIARKCPSCQNYFAVREDTLAAAVQRVEALDLHKHYRIECEPPSKGYVYAEHRSCDLVAQVTAAIKGDQP